MSREERERIELAIKNLEAEIASLQLYRKREALTPNDVEIQMAKLFTVQSRLLHLWLQAGDDGTSTTELLRAATVNLLGETKIFPGTVTAVKPPLIDLGEDE